MRIAQVSPLYESVPPQCYGGTERVVHFLTEELVRQGHDVTLFASGDSVTAARLRPMCERSLRLDPSSVDALAQHVRMLEHVFRSAAEFDVVHFHIDYLHFPLSRRARLANVTTLHGRLDIADLVPLYHEFPDMPLVSISNSQREPLAHARWVKTVYHGLPPGLFHLQEEPESYLAFLGRISPEKRVDRAVEIARGAGLPLRVAAKIDDADQKYFEEEIAPLFELPFVEFIGEIGEADKQAFLGNARALLFPIDWREPFGLVMIEAMACGTPVIGWPGGSVTEVIDEGVTGFIVEEIDDAVAATKALSNLSRRHVREVFDVRFTAERMARDYVAVYESVFSDIQPPQTHRPVRVA